MWKGKLYHIEGDVILDSRFLIGVNEKGDTQTIEEVLNSLSSSAKFENIITKNIKEKNEQKEISNKNNMDIVCSWFGLKLFEKFNIIQIHPCASRTISNPYYFTDEGLMNRYGVLDNIHLADLINKSLKVEVIKND